MPTDNKVIRIRIECGDRFQVMCIDRDSVRDITVRKVILRDILVMVNDYFGIYAPLPEL